MHKRNSEIFLKAKNILYSLITMLYSLIIILNCLCGICKSASVCCKDAPEGDHLFTNTLNHNGNFSVGVQISCKLLTHVRTGKIGPETFQN